MASDVGMGTSNSPRPQGHFVGLPQIPEHILQGEACSVHWCLAGKHSTVCPGPSDAGRVGGVEVGWDGKQWLPRVA